MLQYIKKIEESDNEVYVNEQLKIGWVLLSIVSLKNKFLYVIGKWKD